jgi:hypothetical protein
MNKAHGLITDLLKNLNLEVWGFGSDDGSYDPIVSMLRAVRWKNGVGMKYGPDVPQDESDGYRFLVEEQVKSYLGQNTACLSDNIVGTDSWELLIDLVAILVSYTLTDSAELLNDRVQMELPF